MYKCTAVMFTFYAADLCVYSIDGYNAVRCYVLDLIVHVRPADDRFLFCVHRI